MSLDSSTDYSALKDAVLEMWVPAVGAKTADEWWRKNWQKSMHCVYGENYPFVFHDLIEKSAEVPLEGHLFKTNFESYFDPQPPFQLGEKILTGSLSEGLFLYSTEPPDMDFMCVLKNITFSHEDQENGSLVLREETPFVYAFVTNKETQEMWSEFFDDADTQIGRYRLSAIKLKGRLQENYKKTGEIFHTLGKEELDEINEGAAMTIRKPKPSVSIFDGFAGICKKIFGQPIHVIDRRDLSKTQAQATNGLLYNLVPSSDIVLSVSCEGWPSCAREWITRDRLWPDIQSVEKIKHSGFHIVPKSSRDGDFRLSFSCAETMLTEALSPLQHRVMRAFKAVVKYHQSILHPTFEGIVSSYYLKTVAFWYFEKSPREIWTEETLVHHLVALLQELAEAFRVKNLPMYFMPKVNLLRDVDDPEVTLSLMEKISQLSHNYSVMCDAVNNSNTFNSLLASDSDRKNIENILDAIFAEGLKKLEEGDNSSFTLIHFFLAMDKFLN